MENNFQFTLESITSILFVLLVLIAAIYQMRRKLAEPESEYVNQITGHTICNPTGRKITPAVAFKFTYKRAF